MCPCGFVPHHKKPNFFTQAGGQRGLFAVHPVKSIKGIDLSAWLPRVAKDRRTIVLYRSAPAVDAFLPLLSSWGQLLDDLVRTNSSHLRMKNRAEATARLEMVLILRLGS
jgi:hypothetical protein